MKRFSVLLLLAVLTIALTNSQTQSASLLPNGEQTFVDQNGQPFAGGSVYFYVPNTTTPSTTWSDAGQTVPNSNPVILDAAGRATIYGIGTYRQVLKDQFGNTIWDKLSSASGTNLSQVAVVNNITGLQAIGLAASQNLSVQTLGWASAGDGGGGLYNWNSSSIAAADCIHIVATGVVTGRYVLAVSPGGLNIDQCGAVGDGSTNSSTGIAAAFASSQKVTCTSGLTYRMNTGVTINSADTSFLASGCIFAPHLSPSSAPMFDVEASGFNMTGMKAIAGSGGWAFFVGTSGAVSDVKLGNLTCDGGDNAPMSGCVTIGTVTNFSLTGWTAKSSGYGLLQKSGTNSHSVAVSQFLGSDMYADFINENSTTGVSNGWIISNGTFLGSHGWPSLTTEQRFLAATTADITITNVSAAQANGDSCIHLEGTATLQISNSTLADCLGQFIEYNNTANTLQASNLTLLVNSNHSSCCIGISGVGNSYANKITATGVNCIDLSGTHALDCFELSGHTGLTTIVGGTSTGLDVFAITDSTANLSISGTTLTDVTDGIFGGQTAAASGKGIVNLTLVGNNWDCIAWCIKDGPNTNATNPPSNWNASANHFDHASTASGVDVIGLVEGYSVSEWYGSNLSATTFADTPGANTLECNDFLKGTGLIHTGGC